MLEWYHRGYRRYSNPFKSGGIFITSRWLDSHVLESRLFIAWVSEQNAGQWICLERSGNNSKSKLVESNYQNTDYAIHNFKNAEFVQFVYDKINIEVISKILLFKLAINYNIFKNLIYI